MVSKTTIIFALLVSLSYVLGWIWMVKSSMKHSNNTLTKQELQYYRAEAKQRAIDQATCLEIRDEKSQEGCFVNLGKK